MREHKSVSRAELKQMLKNSNGKFFSVAFRKKDDSIRLMNCRTGVKKYLKGGENKVEAPGRPYVTVFDVQAKGYRTVNVDTIQSVKINGKIYKPEK